MSNAKFHNFRIGDVIMKVNTTNCLGVSHDVAVEAFKQSGNVVQLVWFF